MLSIARCGVRYERLNRAESAPADAPPRLEFFRLEQRALTRNWRGNRGSGGCRLRFGFRFRRGLRLLNIDAALEERAVFDGDARGCNVAGREALLRSSTRSRGMDIAVDPAMHNHIPRLNIRPHPAVRAHCQALPTQGIEPSTSPSTIRSSLPESSPLTTTDFPIVATSLLRRSSLRGQARPDAAARARPAWMRSRQCRTRVGLVGTRLLSASTYYLLSSVRAAAVTPQASAGAPQL